MHKPKKPKVIEIPIQKQEAGQKIFEGKYSLDGRHQRTEINLLSGTCCICGKIAQKILKYDVTDADDDSKIFRIERYCDSCYQRWVVEIEDNKDKEVLLTATNGKDQLIYEKVDKKSTNSE